MIPFCPPLGQTSGFLILSRMLITIPPNANTSKLNPPCRSPVPRFKTQTLHRAHLETRNNPYLKTTQPSKHQNTKQRLSEANPPGSVSKRLDAGTLARLLTDLGTSLNISNKAETMGVRDFELRQRGSVEGRRGAREGITRALMLKKSL